MKKVFFLFFSFFYLYSASLLSIQKETWHSPSGIPIEITYRALQPGEIIVISIKDSLRIKDVQIRFLGQKYQVGNASSESHFFSFIGLDLGLKSGSYSMRISLQDAGGEWETLEKDIAILSKTFPEKKLWVAQKFVIPPPQVQERIKREAAILRSLYGIFTPQWLGEEEFLMPASGKAVANFGERRIYNNRPRSSHGGVDISAPARTPVRASNSGRVVLASDLYFSGKTVIIDHGLGLFTLYCHFSKIKVKRGDQVGRGDVIGEVGATGRVTGPHLHWGVKIYGSRVDPFSLLSFSVE